MSELWELDNTSSPQKVLIYGATKSGKTQLAGTLSKKFRLHWFDFENGYKTLLKLPMEQKKNILLTRMQDSHTDHAAIDLAIDVALHFESKVSLPLKYCASHGKKVCKECSANENAVWRTFDKTKLTTDDIIVFDSATQLSTSAMHMAMKKFKRNSFEGVKADYDTFMFQGNVLDRVFNAIQGCNSHIVVISHENGIEDTEGKEQLFPVAGTRNFSRSFGRYFDHVVRLYKKNGEHATGSKTTSFRAALAGSRLDIDITNDLLPLFDPEVLKKIAEEKESNPVVQKVSGNSALANALKNKVK